MPTTDDRLERWKQIAQIVSSIAVPIVLGVVGWIVQNTLSDAGLKKDYVQMALAVLKEQPSSDNKELRQWAIAVLDKHSPVPLPGDMKAQLQSAPFWLAKEPYAEVETTVECKPAPDAATVDWLVKNFPNDFARCATPTDVGQRKFKGFVLGTGAKWPSAAASAPK